MDAPAETVFRSLVERAADALLLLDPEGRIAYANPAAEDLFGLPGRDLVGENFGGLATSEQTSEIYIPNPRRGLVAASIRRASIELAGEPCVALYLRDVTERVREAERLRQFAVVFDAISEGVMITTPDTAIVAVNRAFTNITGYTQDEVLGRTPEFLRSEAHDAEFYNEIGRVLKREGQWHGELRKRRKDGEIYLELLSINAVRRDDGELIYYAYVFADVTSVHTLRHRAEHDPLTEVFNRYAFQERLEEEMRRAKRYGGAFSLIMFDLDHFKAVNDGYGHDVGDEVLRRVASLAGEELRDGDLLARWGGEEFMILLPETDPESARLVAERIRARIARTDLEGAPRVTVSLGIAGSIAGEPHEELIRRVDRALYQAKEAGRNRGIVAPEAAKPAPGE
ncbi:MAG: diguanylate cyclase [Gammaproteobacteria bacterium]|nr:diguanylate cyclase [Gammaproteobacteria bacterium]